MFVYFRRDISERRQLIGVRRIFINCTAGPRENKLSQARRPNEFYVNQESLKLNIEKKTFLTC